MSKTYKPTTNNTNCSEHDCKKDISFYQRMFDEMGMSYRIGSTMSELAILKVLKLIGILDLSNDSRIMDYGCGTGVYSPYLKSQYSNTIGLDAVLTNLKIAQSLVPMCDYVCGDAYRLPFKDQSFDAVWCSGVLYQFPNLLHPLKEINRVLAEDGYLYISEPNAWNPMSFRYRSKNMEGYERKHCHQLSYRMLRGQLSQAGFKIVKRRGINFSLSKAQGIWKLAKVFEPFLESLPLINMVGGTLCVTAKKLQSVAK